MKPSIPGKRSGGSLQPSCCNSSCGLLVLAGLLRLPICAVLCELSRQTERTGGKSGQRV